MRRWRVNYLRDKGSHFFSNTQVFGDYLQKMINLFDILGKKELIFPIKYQTMHVFQTNLPF